MGSHSITCHVTEVRIPPLLPDEAGTQFSDPGGMQGWVDLCYMKVDRPGIEPRPVSHKSNAQQSHHATHMAVLCAMPTIQYSAGSGASFVHKLFTFCIRWCLVSRACDWVMSVLSAVLLIFSYQFSLLFFHVGQPGRTAAYWFTQYRTSDVAENLGRGNDFQLILMVKMETRHHVEGSFGSDVPAICNHCVVMAAWSRKM